MHRIRRGLDVVIVLAALESAAEMALRDEAPDVWFAVPAVALVVLPLLGRHRFPFAAPACVWLAAITVSFAEGRLVVFTVSVFVAGLVASFLLGNVDDAVRARLGLATVLCGGALVVCNDPDHDTAQLAFIPILFAIAWLAGFALREHATQAEAAERRATDAERERETAARIAVAEERARVARELHDIVAHAMSVMVLQVGAIRHKLPAELAEERSALRDVEGAGRTALTEMRRLLGALRQEGEDAELSPHPGLADLDTLVAEVGRAGLPVRLRVEGETVALPEAIDRSAYRIVQEGLTNVLKHADARQAEVTVHYGPDELRLEVRDNGTGAPEAGSAGHGLAGIRERVKIYGGEMTAEPLPERGFVLSTRLPLATS